MFAAFKQLFDTVAAPSSGDDEHALRLATAVLLVETMRADATVSPVERAHVLDVLRRRFALDASETARLLALGEEAAADAYDYHRFTSLLMRRFDLPRRVQIIELMWQVAYADGELSAHENHLMRKIADLLHVPLPDYAAAKARARQALDAQGRG